MIGLIANPSDPRSHVAMIARGLHPDADQKIELTIDPERATPRTVGADGKPISDDVVLICRNLAPELFPDADGHDALANEISSDLIDFVVALGHNDDQTGYENDFATYKQRVRSFDTRLAEQRYLTSNTDISFADLLLFAFAVRIDAVYYELFKANAFTLADLPALHAFARDIYELPAAYASTDFEAIKRHYYLAEPILNAKRIIPAGGIPLLHHPHKRDLQFASRSSASIEEDQDKARLDGEWVRPHSKHRHWIAADGSTDFPAEAGRYHLYAPYNCPWSHRALLARAVKGLDNVVGATVVYFRRDPEHGWQMNPCIPGCTDDPVYGIRYLDELYARSQSSERSAPVLWDTTNNLLVSNESAEILRMFNSAFGDMAKRANLDLYPQPHRDAIDWMNETVYQRINNGAYKAGFTNSQSAYENAFARYFATLDWLDTLLADHKWLIGTPELTEADLRLFPTIFRHDAVYHSRFKLNHRRITDYPALSSWLSRMLEVPGIADACNLDHARNGYFGRTGNEVVPAGPVPLTLSRKDFTDDVWLNK